MIVTVKRVSIASYALLSLIFAFQQIRTFTITCWTIFALLNTAYILLEFCCLITPLKSNQFYTFGYGEFEPTRKFYVLKRQYLFSV